MTPAEALAKAADVIEERGWCRASYYDGDRDSGPVCVHGAINVALEGDPVIVEGKRNQRTKSAAFSRLGSVVGRGPVAWNDSRGRRREQVVAALRKAAAS